jgi:hypothetical protein
VDSSCRGGFDVHIDPTEDHWIGETIMVEKRKKSHVALDGLFDEAIANSVVTSQTSLGDSTNAPAPPICQVPKNST